MRTGKFCKYKACGCITKHPSGYCKSHNKQWVAGYKYALKELQGFEPTQAGAGGTLLIDGSGAMSDDDGGDNRSLSFEFTFGREGEGDEGIRRQDGLGLPTLPHLVRSGECAESRKEKGLGCGIHQAD